MCAWVVSIPGANEELSKEKKRGEGERKSERILGWVKGQLGR